MVLRKELYQNDSFKTKLWQSCGKWTKWLKREKAARIVENASSQNPGRTQRRAVRNKFLTFER